MSSIWIGIMLGLRPVCGIIASPIINRYILSWSVELTIFISGFVYGIGFCVFAFVSLIDNTNGFLALSVITQALIGVAQASMQIG